MNKWQNGRTVRHCGNIIGGQRVGPGSHRSSPRIRPAASAAASFPPSPTSFVPPRLRLRLCHRKEIQEGQVSPTDRETVVTGRDTVNGIMRRADTSLVLKAKNRMGGLPRTQRITLRPTKSTTKQARFLMMNHCLKVHSHHRSANRKLVRSTTMCHMLGAEIYKGRDSCQIMKNTLMCRSMVLNALIPSMLVSDQVIGEC